MSYQEELNRLQKVITSDDSEDEQREVARKAKKKLIDNSIDEAFASLEERASEYTILIGRLKDVVDRITANQLTTAMEDFDALTEDINVAASGNE
jgi:hypothetical protein